MKIAMLNFSGNTGKSTLSKNLFAPNLPGSKRITIETINAGAGGADLELSAKRFKELAEELLILGPDEHAVIDIGSSNIETVIRQMTSMTDFHKTIDYFVIPVTPEKKQVTDTINTAKALAEIGVDPQKIVAIANRVEDADTVSTDFAAIINLAKKKLIQFADKPVLESDLYGAIADSDKSVYQFADDQTDYTAAIAAASDRDSKLTLARAKVNQGMAVFTAKNLTAVFESTPIAAALNKSKKAA